MDSKNVNNVIEELCENLKKQFDNRIVCLLYYGSNAYNREIKKNSDYDFCLVLNQRETEDLSKIRNITKKLFKVELTLHYLKDLETDGWDNFQSDNHGVFYLYHFASAKAIIGNNIFTRKIHLIQTNDVIDSLRRQIIEYFWRLDNKIFTLSDEELIKSDVFRKYPVRIAQDLLIARGDISFVEINQIDYNCFYDKFVKDKKYFQNQTKELLLMVINRDRITVEKLISLKEVLYEDFRRIFKEYN